MEEWGTPWDVKDFTPLLLESSTLDYDTEAIQVSWNQDKIRRSGCVESLMFNDLMVVHSQECCGCIALDLL